VQISEAVASGQTNIPQLGAHLQELILQLNRELGTLQLPPMDTVIDGSDSRPHIKGCVMNLDVLNQILSIVPQQVCVLACMCVHIG
jgi:hypothetical protein